MRTIKWLLTGLALLVVAVVAFNTLQLKAPPGTFGGPDLAAVDSTSAAQRLAGALSIATVIHENPADVDWIKWRRLHEYLGEQFPRAHAALARETVADYSLLYTWPGSDPALSPVVLLAHQDVVPVEPGTEDTWTHPPFAGVVADGFVWGRGAIDDKASLMAILEATEWLLAQGVDPVRTLIFAFGHDEEVGGHQGAARIAALLRARGVRAWFTLDEGTTITNGVVPSVQRPVALLAVGEKGHVTLRLTATGEGGHSSIPPPETAVSRVARAVTRVQDNPVPQRLLPVVMDGFRRIAPEMSLPRRVALANEWLFAPLLRRAFAAQPGTNATTRTTTAATVISGGIKANILPTQACAEVNCRVLPGESVEDVEGHVRRAIDDPDVRIERFGSVSEPSQLAVTDSEAFALIARTITEVFSDAVVAPTIVPGLTDNRHYSAVRDNGYYFMPVRMAQEDLERLHSTNERISVRDYGEMVRFYVQLMRNVAGK